MAAAPLVWADTRHSHRPKAATLDFAGYVARAVPGKTWLELKTSINDNAIPFPEDFRWRCLRDLVFALALLEQEGIVHGDLSPNNIIVDLEAPPDQPALFLIDFDAFMAPAAEGIAAVTVFEGGTYGTEGYCPPDLAAAVAEGDGSVRPIRIATGATCCCWNCSSWTAACRRTTRRRVGTANLFSAATPPGRPVTITGTCNGYLIWTRRPCSR